MKWHRGYVNIAEHDVNTIFVCAHGVVNLKHALLIGDMQQAYLRKYHFGTHYNNKAGLNLLSISNITLILGHLCSHITHSNPNRLALHLNI